MEICPACTVTLIVVGVVLVLAIIVAAVLAFWTFKADAMVVVPTHVAAVEMPKPAVVPVQMCVSGLTGSLAGGTVGHVEACRSTNVAAQGVVEKGFHETMAPGWSLDHAASANR
eukprot:s49_g66.t2